MASNGAGGCNLNTTKNQNKRGRGFTKCMTLATMGRGKFLEMMVKEVAVSSNVPMTFECYRHNTPNQTVPHCRKCCQYELWTPKPGQAVTYSGDQFID